MAERPDWYYDDLRQVGLDFTDADEVAAYDARQGRDPAQERAALARLELAPGETLLDIGCGTGRLVREAARQGLSAVGYDVSPAMLAHARAEAAAEALAGADFRLGGFLSFDWQGPPPDAVASSYALHHLPDFWKQVALLRIARLLPPGGRFLLRDVAFSFPAEGYAEGVEAWLRAQSRADFATHVREEHSTFAWVLEGMLARAGLDVRSRELAEGVYADYLCRRS